MTEITYEDRPVVTMSIYNLGETFISMTLTFEDGTKETLGYFKQEA